VHIELHEESRIGTGVATLRSRVQATRYLAYTSAPQSAPDTRASCLGPKQHGKIETIVSRRYLTCSSDDPLEHRKIESQMSLQLAPSSRRPLRHSILPEFA
jgi:hypothetical protein